MSNADFNEQQFEREKAEAVAAERERIAKKCNDVAEDYRNQARRDGQDRFLAARFAAYATALDDMAAEIRKA